MVSTGTCFAAAACRAGSRPSELSGATMRNWAPWLSMSWTSLICLDSCDWAFVVSSFLTPSLAASSLIDWVSAIRNGLASFSDWEKPTTASFRSSLVAPYCCSVQLGPVGDELCTTWAPPLPDAAGVLESSLLVQAASGASRATRAIAEPARRRERATDLSMIGGSFGRGGSPARVAGGVASRVVGLFGRLVKGSTDSYCAWS